MIDTFIQDLKDLFRQEAETFHHQRFEGSPAETVPLPKGLHEGLREALVRTGIERLYVHQAEAVNKVLKGRHTVVVTPTASGKTLAYNLPVLESVLADENARALYIFPIKALEQDQHKAVTALAAAVPGGKGATAAIYDGDTTAYQRRKIRQDPPNILITNPDMLHRAFLPYHPSWKVFFQDLRYVVLDELHHYKGVFGSHVAQVLRRLHRVARSYGADPVTVACSATIANPAEHAKALTGLSFDVVSRDGAPRAARHFVFVNPEVSAYTAASRIFTHAVRNGLKTIAFTKARKITELIYTWVMGALPDMADKISSYRAGFLPSERREIEAALATGEMAGVISTSALELGIDIGGLDVCVLVGYPGTIINTWQRGGRVGRGERESVIVLVAMRDALDQYFMRHPEDFFGRSFESVALDPFNEQILGPHLECAAAELPITQEDDTFDLVKGEKAVRLMERQRRLLRSADGRRIFAARLRPQRFVDIRAIGKGYTIFESGTKKVIGSVSGVRALSECHLGAVYLHRGRKYTITELDMERMNITAEVSRSDYYTKAVSEKETEILEILQRRPSGNFILNFGRLKVTEIITGFQKRNQRSQELLSAHPLDLPPQVFETTGIWFEFPHGLEGEMRQEGRHFMGGLHALEHGVIAVFPLITLCDRFDLGGIATTHHPDVEAPAVFIYDGYPGGVGLCERGFAAAENLLEKTLRVLSDCPCEEGCPSCVHSPKCGSGNKPLDKGATISILEIMLDRRQLTVQEAPPVPVVEAPGPPKETEQAHDVLRGRRVMVFDLETQRSAAEVGGWNRANLMRVSVGVVWDSRSRDFQSFTEPEVNDLVALLQEGDLVVGFNNLRFDNTVLSGYVPKAVLDKLPNFDILDYIKREYDFRISLAKLAQATLEKGKSADGLQALAWFRDGEMEKLTRYCRDDVAITRDLFLYGLTRGYLLYDRKGEAVRLPVEWDIEKLPQNRT